VVGLFYSGDYKKQERRTGNREKGKKNPNVNPVPISDSLTHSYFFPFFKWNFPVPLELRKLLEA